MEKLYIFLICLDDIVKIVESLDPNKAYGQDEISIRMTKTCPPSISKSLVILFRNCF